MIADAPACLRAACLLVPCINLDNATSGGCRETLSGPRLGMLYSPLHSIPHILDDRLWLMSRLTRVVDPAADEYRVPRRPAR